MTPWRKKIATKLPRALDRRVKITDEIREKVKQKRLSGMGIREIARDFEGVISRRSVQFILDPKRYDKVRQQFKERRKDGRYKPDKKQWAATMREHRRYKVTVIKL